MVLKASIRGSAVPLVAAFCAVAARLPAPHAATMTTLYDFCAQSNCADDTQPEGTLLGDKAGNLYGTFYRVCQIGGTAAGSDGEGPMSGLAIAGSTRGLYGVTRLGGADDAGTVFEISR